MGEADGSQAREMTRKLLLEKDPEELVDLILDLSTRLELLEGKAQNEPAAIDSRSSSLPPSSDPPGAAAERRKRKKEKRKASAKSRGAQRGHRGKNRKMVPVEDVDALVEVPAPKRCTCGGKVAELDERPARHQVWELPEIRPTVTEYQLFSGVCSCCGELTTAELPQGVSSSMFGPRVAALIGYLSGGLRVADRPIAEALEQLFGLEMSLGTVANIRRRLGEALSHPTDEVRDALRQQEVVNIDETSWWVGNQQHWLWAATTPDLSYFAIQPGRGKWDAQQLLGEDFAGTGVTDRLYSYNWLDLRQVCWAHLARDFHRIASRPGIPGVLGEKMEKIAEAVMRIQRRLYSEEITKSTFREYGKRLRRELRPLLEAGTSCKNAKTEGTCKAVLERWRELWTFLRNSDVPVTNNAAERIIRHAVLWRKARYRTQSEGGTRYVERILTAVTTLKQQGRKILDYLQDLIVAHWSDETPLPSLVPI